MPVTDVEKDVDALTLTITAEFDADAERLWELWADPRQLERWWSPPSHSSTFVEHELTVGARTTYFMTGPDGEKHHGRWRIEEVERPYRLQLKDDEVDDKGKRVGRLVEFDDTSKIFTNPGVERTRDYITGRYG